MSEIVEGAKAPAFKGTDQNGNTISLTDFSGKKINLVFLSKR